MKYFVRELHGTMCVYRLIALESGVPPGPEGTDPNDTIIAHCYQVTDSPLTKFLMGEDYNDFAEHWHKGPDKTASGHSHGGHHVGEWKEITQEKAEEILKLLED